MLQLFRQLLLKSILLSLPNIKLKLFLLYVHQTCAVMGITRTEYIKKIAHCHIN